MPEVYVIWPSEGAVGPRGVTSLHATIKACKAEGYANRAARVRACIYIVITSGNNKNAAGVREHYLAEILDVVSPSVKFPAKPGGKGRIDVTFSKTMPILNGPLKTKLDDMGWGQNNTQFLQGIHEACRSLLP